MAKRKKSKGKRKKPKCSQKSFSCGFSCQPRERNGNPVVCKSNVDSKEKKIVENFAQFLERTTAASEPTGLDRTKKQPVGRGGVDASFEVMHENANKILERFNQEIAQKNYQERKYISAAIPGTTNKKVAYSVISMIKFGFPVVMSSEAFDFLSEYWNGKGAEVSWFSSLGIGDEQRTDRNKFRAARTAQKMWAKEVLPQLEPGTLVYNTPLGGAGGARDRAYQRAGFGRVTNGGQYAIVGNNNQLIPIDVRNEAEVKPKKTKQD